MANTRKYGNDQVVRKKRGGEELSKRAHIAQINLSDLSPKEKEQMTLLKTIAFVFYKQPDHDLDEAPQRKHHGGVGRYLTKPAATVDLSYTIGELRDTGEALPERMPKIKSDELKEELKTKAWLGKNAKRQGFWSIDQINDMDKWEDVLTKHHIGYTINLYPPGVTLDAKTLSKFIESSEPYIRALELKEKAEKKADPTGDRTDSYLIASLNSINRHCNPTTITM